MKKEEAEQILSKLTSRPENVWERKMTYINFGYPGLVDIFMNYLSSSQTKEEFHEKSINYIMTVNTKLAKALK